MADEGILDDTGLVVAKGTILEVAKRRRVSTLIEQCAAAAFEEFFRILIKHLMLCILLHIYSNF
jgi:hypothetical protein